MPLAATQFFETTDPTFVPANPRLLEPVRYTTSHAVTLKDFHFGDLKFEPPPKTEDLVAEMQARLNEKISESFLGLPATQENVTAISAQAANLTFNYLNASTLSQAYTTTLTVNSGATLTNSMPVVFNYDVTAGQYTIPYSVTSTGAGIFQYGTGTTNWNNTWAVSNVDGSTWTLVTNSPPTAQEVLRQEIRNRMSYAKSRRSAALGTARSPQEQKARDTLRDMISEQEWRRYVTNGFLMVKGPSGRHYQVFNDSRHVQVFEKNKNIAGLCIHSDSVCPPSDHVINIKLLIEMDEAQVWQGSNVNWKPGCKPQELQPRIDPTILAQMPDATTTINWGAIRAQNDATLARINADPVLRAEAETRHRAEEMFYASGAYSLDSAQGNLVDMMRRIKKVG